MVFNLDPMFINVGVQMKRLLEQWGCSRFPPPFSVYVASRTFFGLIHFGTLFMQQLLQSSRPLKEPSSHPFTNTFTQNYYTEFFLSHDGGGGGVEPPTFWLVDNPLYPLRHNLPQYL